MILLIYINEHSVILLSFSRKMFRPATFLHLKQFGHQNASFAQFLHPFKYKKRCKWNMHCNYLSTQNQQHNQAKFILKNALIVSKLSRYEYEQHRHQRLKGHAFEQALRDRGTDYDALLHHHHIHKSFEQKVADSFRHFGVNVKILNRLSFSTEHTKWADVIVPIGGDGTFLLAAGRGSPIGSLKKPVFGFNSDPIRSEGRLMLPKQYSYDPKKAVHKLITGDFEWLHRSRIRITMFGQNGSMPVSNDMLENEPTRLEVKECQTEQLNENDKKKYCANIKRILPYLALNEVFIGETMSARVSHLHLKIDDNDYFNKTKSSGLCVSTGTGSSSWLTSINRMSVENVKSLFEIIKACGGEPLGNVDADRVSEEYNQALVFQPDDPRLCYSIREQICIGVWPNPAGFESRGFAKKMLIKSRCEDASLVIDGGIAYPFNDGAKVLLEVNENDTLLTISLNDRNKSS